MYVYKRTEFSPYCLYTVGYYDPNGKWHPESDHENAESAANRIILLNGGKVEINVNPDLLEACNLFINGKKSRTFGYYSDDQIKGIELMKEVIKKVTE